MYHHELKTPIFNIQGYIQTLLDGGLEDKDVNMKFLKEYLLIKVFKCFFILITKLIQVSMFSLFAHDHPTNCDRFAPADTGLVMINIVEDLEVHFKT